MVRGIIPAILGILSVLVSAFYFSSPETSVQSVPAESQPTTVEMEFKDLIVPVLLHGKVEGYLVVSMSANIETQIENSLATWYLTDAFLQVLHDDFTPVAGNDLIPESGWLSTHLKAAANLRLGTPFVHELQFKSIKFLERI